MRYSFGMVPSTTKFVNYSETPAKYSNVKLKLRKRHRCTKLRVSKLFSSRHSQLHADGFKSTHNIFFPLVCCSPLQPAYAQFGAVRQIRRMGRFWLPKESDM